MMQTLIEIAAHIAALMMRFVFIAVFCFAVVSKNTALACVISLASASTFDALSKRGVGKLKFVIVILMRLFAKSEMRTSSVLSYNRDVVTSFRFPD